MPLQIVVINSKEAIEYISSNKQILERYNKLVKQYKALGISFIITEDIITEEVIITENQIQHIKDRHPEAYNKVLKNIQETISTPDYIIRDKHAYTGLIIKRIQTEEGFLQIVLRLCTSGDEHGYKNSVISCWKISERRLQNYLRNKEILYSRE